MDSLLEIFCNVDDFCKGFLPWWNAQLIADGKKKRNRESKMSLSEIMTILIYFHHSHYRDFKHYYTHYVCKHLHSEFPEQLSYSRFVKLIPSTFMPITAYLLSLKGECTGISFVDSYPIKVCHNRRIHQNKTFDGIAQRGHTSMGFFYGFKLHLTVNDRGEPLSFCFSKGNMNDRKPMRYLTKNLIGKLFGDKGYLSKQLFESLYKDGLQLITKIKKGMKNQLMPLFDKLLLRKRAIIESVGDHLKNVCQLEHTRHRSPANFLVHLVCALIAYIHLPKKPSLQLSKKEQFFLALA